MTEQTLPEELIFAQARELPEAERAAFLDQACGTDPMRTTRLYCAFASGVSRPVAASQPANPPAASTTAASLQLPFLVMMCLV